MIVAMAASVVLVVTTILILYETLRLTSNHLAELPLRPRARIIAVVLATFIGHTAAVWTYALGYWVLAVNWQVGGFAGLPVEGFQDCLYFSVVTYTSLGFGDHIPISHARLIAGVEALNGLLLIGWSASFTYLVMERYWPLHGEARAGPSKGGSAGAYATTTDGRVHNPLRREHQSTRTDSRPATGPSPRRACRHRASSRFQPEPQIEIRDPVTVHVQKGWVTLAGTVEDAYQPRVAEVTVRKLDGVGGVSNM